MIRSSGFGAVIVGTLALGDGVNTAVFSVVGAVLLRVLPAPRRSGATGELCVGADAAWAQYLGGEQ